MISSDHLKPGDIGRVKATVETANLNGPAIKHLSVYSNDRVSPVLSLELKINVAPNDVAPKDNAPMGVAPKVMAPTGVVTK